MLLSNLFFLLFLFSIFKNRVDSEVSRIEHVVGVFVYVVVYRTRANRSRDKSSRLLKVPV